MIARLSDHRVGLWVLFGLAAGLFILGAAAMAAANVWLPNSNLAIGYLMEVCLWRAGGQSHLLLYSPFISAYTPPGSAQCLYVPWLPVIPHWAHLWRWA